MSAARKQRQLFGSEGGVRSPERGPRPELVEVIQDATRPEVPAPNDQPPLDHERERAQVLAAVRAARARWRIGDMREADNPCPACGHERLERLEEIAAEGGQTWVVMCVIEGCARSRRAIGAGRWRS